MGTTSLNICPVCGQSTLDNEDNCHNIDCDPDFLDHYCELEQCSMEGEQPLFTS